MNFKLEVPSDLASFSPCFTKFAFNSTAITSCPLLAAATANCPPPDPNSKIFLGVNPKVFSIACTLSL